MMTNDTAGIVILELTADVAAAWLANPDTKISAEDLPAAIAKLHAALAGLGKALPVAETSEPEHVGAVTVRRSLASPDHIISMIDGKPYKMLKRHLGQNGLTPQQYRERYGLKADYPMVAESYAAKRRDLAVKIGLGRKRGSKVAVAAQAVATPPNTDAPLVQAKVEAKVKYRVRPKKLGLFNGSSAETTDLA